MANAPAQRYSSDLLAALQAPPVAAGSTGSCSGVAAATSAFPLLLMASETRSLSFFPA